MSNLPLPLPQFHIHPDGTLYVRSKDGVYADTPDNFAKDMGAPVPDLPSGATEQLYIQGVSHAYLNRSGIVDGGPMPWQFGDVAIYGVKQLLLKQANRKAGQ